MAKAYWRIELETRCPKCKTELDLFSFSSFCLEHEIQVGEHDTDSSRNLETFCPHCEHEFKVDLVY